ncbi:hypothetical protein D9M70_554810 [compost metagenome]
MPIEARVESSLPSIHCWMMWSQKVREAKTVALTSARVKRVFWKSSTGLPNTLRSLVYSRVSSRARSIEAAEPMAICARS